jgi:ribose transport system permease protein
MDKQAPNRMGTLRGELPFLFPIRYRVVWLALAALVVVCLFVESAIFSSNSLTLVTTLAGILAIAAAGQLLVVMSGGIDLSIPSVMALAGAVIVKQTDGADDKLFLAVLLALALAAAIGLVNGLLVTVAKLNALIVTLSTGGVVAGGMIIWATTSYSTTGQAPKALTELANDSIGPISVIGLVGLAALLLLGAILRSTAIGRAFVTSGTNRTAAHILGVRTTAHGIGAYVASSLLAMVGGILLVGVLKVPNPTIGEPYLLTTIVAVALGGASLAGGPASMAGTAAGALFIVMLNRLLQLQEVSQGVGQLANGAALVIAVALVTLGGRTRMRHRDEDADEIDAPTPTPPAAQPI